MATDADKPPSATVIRLVRAAARVADGTPDHVDYLHAVLCQVGLPRKRVEESAPATTPAC